MEFNIGLYFIIGPVHMDLRLPPLASNQGRFCRAKAIRAENAERIC
jgi:hypothetical protein